MLGYPVVEPSIPVGYMFNLNHIFSSVADGVVAPE